MMEPEMIFVIMFVIVPFLGGLIVNIWANWYWNLPKNREKRPPSAFPYE